MKKRDKTKQNKLHKVTTKRALYEKARRQKLKIKKNALQNKLKSDETGE